MFNVMMAAAVTLVALHIASYGWYAWRRENNLRGAVGAYLVAGVTLSAPLVLIWYNLHR